MQLLTGLFGAAAVASVVSAAAIDSDPFSRSKWPYPQKVFGDSDGWGGIHIHDPSIVKKGDYYYSFGTHLRATIGKSPSLHGPWKHIGSVLQNDSIIDLAGRDDIWAPDVSKVGDTYYCYYSVSAFGSQNSAIGLATSKTLEPGSWTDHGEVVRSYAAADYPNATEPWTITNAIDANLVLDAKTGKPWLSYGSFWTDVWQFPLAGNLSAPESSPTPHQLARDPVSPNAEEGPYLHYAEETGMYYLFVSHGICCGYNTSLPAPGKEYEIKVGRSDSVNGPFVDRNGTDMKTGGGEVVYGSHGYVYGPGGQGVLNDGGKDIIYYHYVDTRISYVDEDKLLGWNELVYVDGWPVLV
ncbi:hypothetical protein RUND412_010032 [Rhizina undulata]